MGNWSVEKVRENVINIIYEDFGSSFKKVEMEINPFGNNFYPIEKTDRTGEIHLKVEKDGFGFSHLEEIKFKCVLKKDDKEISTYKFKVKKVIVIEPVYF